MVSRNPVFVTGLFLMTVSICGLISVTSATTTIYSIDGSTLVLYNGFPVEFQRETKLLTGRINTLSTLLNLTSARLSKCPIPLAINISVFQLIEFEKEINDAKENIIKTNETIKQIESSSLTLSTEDEIIFNELKNSLTVLCSRLDELTTKKTQINENVQQYMTDTNIMIGNYITDLNSLKEILQREELEKQEKNQLIDENIKNITKQFEDVQKFLIQLNETDINRLVKKIYNKQENNFDIGLNYADDMALISFDMEKNEYANTIRGLIKFVKSMRRRVIDQILYKVTQAERTAHNIIGKVKKAAKEILKDAILSGQRSLSSDELIIEIVTLQHALFEEIIADVVHDVFNQTGGERLISFIKSFQNDEVVIFGYTAIYNEMQQNDSALFQLYANLKNLTGHNSEQNSALVTDYENLNKKIKMSIIEELKDAMLSDQRGLSDEVAIEIVSSLQYETIKEMIADAVQDAFNRTGANKLISSMKFFTQDELIISGYTAVYNEMRQNDPELFQLYVDLKNLTWHNPEQNSALVTDYETLIEKIKMEMKEVFTNAMLSDQRELSDEFAIEIVSSLKYEMIKEMIADAVQDVFNRTGAKKLISSMKFFTQDELIISGYTAVYNEMRQNDPELFQLYANLKNLTWHNPERNSALITDYETLIRKMKIAIVEVLENAMLSDQHSLSDEFAKEIVSSLKYGMIKEMIADAVHDVFNHTGANKLISSIKSFTQDELIISGYTAVYNEMQLNDPTVFELVTDLKNLTWHNPERNSALITDYETLIKRIKMPMKEVFKNAMLSDHGGLSDEFANKMVSSLQYGIVKEIIADAVHDVFNHTGAKKLISSIKSFTQDELIISGYIAVYNEMEQNDPAIFQLAVDLKNLTWHNPEPNSALDTDYETLKNTIPKFVMAMLSSSEVYIENVRENMQLYACTLVPNYHSLRTNLNDGSSRYKWTFEHEKDDIFSIKSVRHPEYYVSSFLGTPQNECREVGLSTDSNTVGNGGKWKVTLEGNRVQMKNVYLNQYLFSGFDTSHRSANFYICTFTPGTTNADTLWEIKIA